MHSVAELVPNPVSDLAVNIFPQTAMDVALWSRIHKMLPSTLQIVTPFMLPETVHLKVKVSPGQVGGAAVNCPATSPGGKYKSIYCTHLSMVCHMSKYSENMAPHGVIYTAQLQLQGAYC